MNRVIIGSVFHHSEKNVHVWITALQTVIRDCGPDVPYRRWEESRNPFSPHAGKMYFFMPSRAPKIMQNGKVSVIGMKDFSGKRGQRSFLLFETKEHGLPQEEGRG